ncbi:hypothetical protein ElyMa_003466000 [Elysia marginata]|uniref:Uncharacterized protein n=1 Tax=Elysia marginata TaxID=1093978 RepID=A0AAV4EA75_9GAST|nr:hypothetical protein ElyMa_003466000 [Elysia marginata]
MEIDAFFLARQQRIDTYSKEIKVKMCKPILRFTDEATFCLESHASQMTLQGSKQMKVRGYEVWILDRMRKNFPTAALRPLQCKICWMTDYIIMLKHKTPSQESWFFATNCISEAVKSAAV